MKPPFELSRNQKLAIIGAVVVLNRLSPLPEDARSVAVAADRITQQFPDLFLTSARHIQGKEGV